MFNQLLNALTGNATTAAYTFPGVNGVNNIPLSSTLKSFFKNVINSIAPGMPVPGASLGAGFGQAQGSGFPGMGGAGMQGSGFPGMGGAGMQGFNGITAPGLSLGALQAYRGAQNQFLGNGNIAKHSKAQAFTPGAVVTNGAFAQAMPPAFAGNPLQGLTGQSGAVNINGFGQNGGGLNSAQFGGLPGVGLGQTQGGFGKLQFLIAPLIGVFTIFKSLFDMRRTTQALQPIKVNKEDFNLYGIQRDYMEADRQEGSFNEYFPEDTESDQSSDSSRFNSY